MAEIEIQPKKKGGSNWWWILGILAIVGIVVWLLAGRDRKDDTQAVGNKIENAGNAVENAGNAVANKAEDVWEDIDLNAPRVERPEVHISSPDFETRGNDRYTVYAVGEALLFDTDKATLRSDAAQHLEQIAGSINQRYANGQVRVFGFADATGDAQHNQQLSEQRAEAVKNWLAGHTKIDASHISVEPMGESKPAASNETEAGRQQNRRVQIVAQKM